MTGAPTPSPLTAAEQAALDAVDESFTIRTLHDLVAIPSLPAQESAAQQHVADVLRALGADVTVTTLDMARVRAHPAFSAEVERTDPLGVTGIVGDGDGPTLLLNGHVDVVPTGDPAAWSTPPFTPTMVGRRLHGRGTCDMKGGVAAGLAALHAVRAAGVSLPGRVLLSTVVGEEDGGTGTLGALVGGLTADGAIVMEPTRLAVAPAVAGALGFRITVPGLAAHGCLRAEGVSAIEKYVVVQRALLALEDRRNARSGGGIFAHLERPFAICTGRIEAGDWPSSEADWLRAEGRYGVSPDEDLVTARAELEQAVADAAATDTWLSDNPPVVEWFGGQFRPARTATDQPIVTTTLSAAAATGTPAALEGQPYGCDMGLLSTVGGIPTVIFGPGDVRQAHTVDEWVDVDEVIACARALVLTMLRFSGSSG